MERDVKNNSEVALCRMMFLLLHLAGQVTWVLNLYMPFWWNSCLLNENQKSLHVYQSKRTSGS